MSTLLSAIHQGIRTQDKETALISFHRGWDGEIDEETIVQGLISRYTCGSSKGHVVEHGLRVVRDDLKTVRLEAQDPHHPSGVRRLAVVRRIDGDAVSYALRDYRVFEQYAIWVAHPELWHDHELADVSKWLMENFHH